MWTIERMTKSPSANPSLSGWQLVVLDKDTNERRVISLTTTDDQPEDGLTDFFCRLETWYELEPNDFGVTCA